MPKENIVLLNADGPINIHGDVELLSNSGELLLKDTRISLCRCGTSQHKPFCDGLHAINDFFDSGEISSKDSISLKSEIDSPKLRIRLLSNGPLILSGPFTIWDAAGRSSYKGTRASLCRCGASKNRPFCDGSHTQIGFSTE
jgi:CDGSH-type Zn-finger protein